MNAVVFTEVAAPEWAAGRHVSECGNYAIEQGRRGRYALFHRTVRGEHLITTSRDLSNILWASSEHQLAGCHVCGVGGVNE